MGAFLLDVNVLVALSWARHKSHEQAQRWFAAHAAAGWATCPFTQTGFVRIMTNPAYLEVSLKPAEAMVALSAFMQHPGHEFWKDELTFERAVLPMKDRLVGHQQITDAYLLGLAVHNRGKLATLDRGIRGLWPVRGMEQSRVEIIE